MKPLRPNYPPARLVKALLPARVLTDPPIRRRVLRPPPPSRKMALWLLMVLAIPTGHLRSLPMLLNRLPDRQMVLHALLRIRRTTLAKAGRAEEVLTPTPMPGRPPR